jgi:hypothetical protein
MAASSIRIYNAVSLSSFFIHSVILMGVLLIIVGIVFIYLDRK